MEKVLTYKTKTDKGVFLHPLGEGRNNEFLEKTASASFHSEIKDYISNCTKIPGKTQLLLTALGAGEYYGSNVNGDYFPAERLSYEGPEFGYKTFETHAHVFKHHINKDPNKSYGTVALSVWNDKMKRVELIVLIDDSKAPDIVERIENGEYPEVSMGCRVPYDVCSICGNKAKTRKDYCDHLRYYMNKIPPGYSKIAYAINTMPRFFDISFVLIGADRIAKVMAKIEPPNEEQIKVAHTNSFARELDLSFDKGMSKVASEHNDTNFSDDFLVGFKGLSKKGSISKKSEMRKEIPSNLDGNVVAKLKEIGADGIKALRPLEKDIPLTIIIRMAKSNPGQDGLNKVLSTLTHLGIMPKPHEFQSLALRCLGKDSLAEDYERMGLTFDPEADVEEKTKCECDEKLNICGGQFNPNVMKMVEPYIPERSYARPLLLKRVINLVKLAEKGELKYPRDEHVKTAEESSKIGLLPMMVGLSGLWLSLKNKLPVHEFDKFDQFIMRHPAIATALGVGLVGGAKALGSRAVKGQYDFHPDDDPISIGTWEDEIQRRNDNPLLKTSSAINPAGSVAQRLFLGMPALYMVSGAQENKRARNPFGEESAIGEFIRKHPDVASGILVGEGLAGFPVTRRAKNLAGKVTGLAKGGLGLLRKTASVSDDLTHAAVFSLALPGRFPGLRTASTAVDLSIIRGIEELLKMRNK